MRQTATATHAAPVDAAVDPEVLAFRANFEARSPLDELVREVQEGRFHRPGLFLCSRIGLAEACRTGNVRMCRAVRTSLPW